MFCVWEPVNLAKDRLAREKAYKCNFFMFFMCTEVHRKGVEFKEVVRLANLYSILTKKRESGLEGTINCGEKIEYIWEN